MEYQQIVAATERQFTDEERDIEARQAAANTVQALLDRRQRPAPGAVPGLPNSPM